MATPSYGQIQSFGRVKNQLVESAVDEFMEYLYEGITSEEVIDIAVSLGEKYSLLGAELGAQWYDLCSELAGIDAEAAEVAEVDTDTVDAKTRSMFERSQQPTAQAVFNDLMQTLVNDSIRQTGEANLWRDYERGVAGGRWARVPVGDTCAWCLMLASQGAWYLSEKTALGGHAGHYHEGCNCVAVYHANPDSIRGYEKLGKYKQMYYDADNARRANEKGREKYPEELEQRIAAAKATHKLKAKEAEERGEDCKPWTVYNEDMIVMRYKYGLK